MTTVKYYRSEKGVSATIFTGMRRRSRLRKHNLPSFSSSEFRDWLFKQDEFKTLYKEWVESDYDKFKKPSVDRIDDNLGYEYSNMRVVTWQDNDNFGKESKQKPIVGINTETEEEVFYLSVTKASKDLNINRKSISNCLIGTSKSAGGYKWQYQQ